MAQEKTPGVYIREENAFPNSVVEVATAVPAFIGYTEKAKAGKKSLANTPTRISSLAEYEMYYGGPPDTVYTFAAPGDNGEPFKVTAKAARYLLYYSMRLFFDNGGGPCYIVSVGSYKDALSDGDLVGALAPLRKENEPTMIVVPDAVSLGRDVTDPSKNDLAGWQKVCQQVLQHCADMQSRVGILDVYNGNKPLGDPNLKVIEEFRNNVVSDFLNYGMAYYPWLNTSIVEEGDVSFVKVDNKADLVTYLQEGLDPEKQKALFDKIGEIATVDTTDQSAVTTLDLALKAASPKYKEVMGEIREKLNELPPSAGMAGVYTRVDNTLGVFKAPANTGINSVVSPTYNVSHDDQEDLNIPLSGKAVNAFRIFPGKGLLVWGARTLDGNSQDWRYINVRRTMIMLEQSIKFAAQAYVFAPNTASTWVTVKNMLSNYLTNKWKEGALAGAVPADAFSVHVGLGETMTPNDILDGYMRVTVKVAIVRPAEFIVITFVQKMQTS